MRARRCASIPESCAARRCSTCRPSFATGITRFEVAGERSAGAVTLTDDTLQRREVALIDAQGEDEGQALLSPLHYLRQALAPTADLMEGGLSDMLLASPDALILADVATISPDEEEALIDWVERGGLLLRFRRGPGFAASDVARDTAGPLMPVRLRAGGRSVGGAMSWGEPKALSPFPETSPFFGLDIPGDVTVESQVMAQPDPQLSERTIASLTDGTPLVTRAPLGQGSVVLFHVTANADWSSLPLSGLFVQMLERLAVSTRPAIPDAEDVAGITWVPEQVLDGFGTLRDPGIRPGIPGETMVEAPLSADLLPGLYTGGDQAHRAQRGDARDRACARKLAREPACRGDGRGSGDRPDGGVPRRGPRSPADRCSGRALAGRSAQRADLSRGRGPRGRPDPDGADPVRCRRADRKKRRWPDAGGRACAAGHLRGDTCLRDHRRSGA